MAEDSHGKDDISGESSKKSMPAQLTKEKFYQQRQKCELKRLLKHTHPELKMLDEVVDGELAEVLSPETEVTAGETGYEGEVFSRCLIFENCAMSNKEPPHTPRQIHVTNAAVDKGDVSKKSAVFEAHGKKSCNESVQGTMQDNETLGSMQEPDKECEEEQIRINVKASRRIFESQSAQTSRPNPENKFQGVSILGVERGSVDKTKENLHKSTQSSLSPRCLDLTHQSYEKEPSVHVVGQNTDFRFPAGQGASSCEGAFDDDDEDDDPTSLKKQQGAEEIIKTSEALFKNNPFISSNIARENSYVHSLSANPSGTPEDLMRTNVKSRAHLFESMPFAKIRHQNEDEIATLMENIKETLNSLYHMNAIYSDGTIIEVNETMIAKKAKFTLSETGPKLKYDEMAEGGAQNFIVQLLPRTNLKTQITYLKEDRKGSVAATVVNVPVHQHPFPANQETEFKTANVVQIVEDILNQDNSLRKGVIIQEDASQRAEVIVYSLFKYFDEEDVKSYSAPKEVAAQNDKAVHHILKTENEGPRKGFVESTISCLLETYPDQTCTGSIRPEITEKGNVKLFKSCIEKGDLDYLKSLQTEPEEQEQGLPPEKTAAEEITQLHQTEGGDQAEDSSSEWVPVDVKRLKSIFSVDDQKQNQAKQNTHVTHVPPTPITHTFTGQTVSLGTECNVGTFTHGQRNNLWDCHGQAQDDIWSVAQQRSSQHLEMQDDDRVHQALLAEVVDDTDEMSVLQSAIHSLQQATIEAKALHQSSQNKLKVPAQEFSAQPTISVTTVDVNDSGTEAKLHQENEDQRHGLYTELRQDEVPSASDLTSVNETYNLNKNVQTNSEEIITAVTTGQKSEKGTNVIQTHTKTTGDCSETKNEQEENEIVFHSKLQEALDSLERSNINVTRGDFKAAMIYKNSSKPHKNISKNRDMTSVQKPITDQNPVTESNQITLRQGVSNEQLTAGNTAPHSRSETNNKPAVSEKTQRPVGSKPVIPPKPEHLKVKLNFGESGSMKYSENTETNTRKQSKEETVAQTVNHTNENTQMSQKIDMTKFDNINKNTICPTEKINVQPQVKHLQETNAFQDNSNETDESHVDFNQACQKFGGKKAFSVKNAPVKPKRVKIAQPDHKKRSEIPGNNNNSPISEPVEPEKTITKKHEEEIKRECKVEMREKRRRTETEDERRQRLSVHMDEIMRGNMTAAMEIFDNLRKQEELQSILSRVEEIEQDTSDVDVTSLRRAFENVPDWVVSSDKKKQKKVEAEHGEKSVSKGDTQSKSSMAHIFGDLERASEEIMNLKDQTLARLMDIEEAIKKALYSVSTLKSESDIAGLSCLFKESLGSMQEPPPTGNISKISIGSSRTKSPQEHERPTSIGNTDYQAGHGSSAKLASSKQRASPLSSPAFISIQSAVRKTDKTDVVPSQTTICPTCQQSPKTEEVFCTTKTLTCNSPATNPKKDPRKGGQKQPTDSPLNTKREVSVLEVQTDRDGNSIVGTKTVTENYEQTDNFGNRFYSSKTSTVVTTQPETMTSSGQPLVSPATYQVATYPEVRLPINQKP